MKLVPSRGTGCSKNGRKTPAPTKVQEEQHPISLFSVNRHNRAQMKQLFPSQLLFPHVFGGFMV